MTEEALVRAIVLSVDETTNTTVCFSEPLESKINVKLPLNFIAKPGQRLTFGDHDYENETYFPVSNPELITIEDDPSFRFENNEELRTTRAAFSFLDTHPTYAKKKAYAGAFDNDESFSSDLYDFDEKTPAASDDEFVENNKSETELPHVHMNENTESSPRFEQEITEYVLIDVNNDASNESVTSTSIEEAGLSSSSSMPLLNCQSIDLPTQKSDESGETSPEIIPFQEDRFEMVQEEGRDESSVQMDSSSSGYPATETSSLGKDIRGSKPTPLSFGKMPTSSSEKARTTDSVGVNEYQKRDIEYCVVVLNCKSDAVIGFETNILKLMTIVIEETDLNQYGKLRFIIEREENGKIYPKRGTVRYSEPVGTEIVNGTTSIPARVMFSSNPKHGSYNKSVAFSDSYGLVEISESNASLEHITVYNTFIQLCQIDDTLNPIFKSVSPLVEDRNDPNHDFIVTMYNYEDKIFNETRSRSTSSEEMGREDCTEIIVSEDSVQLRCTDDMFLIYRKMVVSGENKAPEYMQHPLSCLGRNFLQEKPFPNPRERISILRHLFLLFLELLCLKAILGSFSLLTVCHFIYLKLEAIQGTCMLASFVLLFIIVNVCSRLNPLPMITRIGYFAGVEILWLFSVCFVNKRLYSPHESYYLFGVAVVLWIMEWLTWRVKNPLKGHLPEFVEVYNDDDFETIRNKFGRRGRH